MTLITKKTAIGAAVAKSKTIFKQLNAVTLACLPVTIKDQDNNTVATVPAGGTYNVLVFDGIHGGAPGTVYTNSIVGGTP